MKPQPLITVQSVPASAEFYALVLGGTLGHGGDEYEQVLVNGEMVLQLHNNEPDENHEALADAAPLGNGVVLWFETDAFEAAVARVAAAKAKVVREPFLNKFARQMEIWLEDPDGYQVVIAGPSEYARG